MSRSLFVNLVFGCLLALIIGLIVLVSCSSRFDGLEQTEVLPPTTVELPFFQIYRNSFFIEISSIPGDADAVKMKVYIHAIRTEETKEWIQRGIGKTFFVLDNGLEKYTLDVLELVTEGNSVKSVKISIENRSRDGPR